ncbi:MAG: DUF389 domain-containing protein [Actinomycetales bacterium]|jgi:uncharacterized hydrophobic protein (TIGR00271 family)|uniref:DUF389 domain-containing protein n=1 Tax=Candidatus Phosphoribacter hodrii TaxID=2953743 RepID=A0A935IKI3_9MICO|nr:DUF389 domain-containing protein [Candidatus Phosphoribacter hodrii]MBP8838574.1 DUF389 domain-containing protein [Dermatophilaceae bacterium]OPZ53494.1 MAG: hypothetical protein BWY91_01938 [bacterium ADurb.BinA028]MBK7272866.1 DUF389 domain-containing protein [Candidatus Phosphoribacter hodrii]MBL0004768.1 DUF389 domain-containing protein [Candidatus Phosphoribacter hodrii]
MSSDTPASEYRIRATAEDVRRMMSRLLLTEGSDTRRKMSAFWVLLVLATVIATSGVVADSTATVIGAMIVAPLMTPILGTALSVVLANRRLVAVNFGLVIVGALCVIAIAYLIGMTSQMHLVADSNSQIAGRVSPRLIDLVGALATGAVGAFATVRSDVSDTLPGVAIAISLVPPLAVVGLTLESGEPSQALGALLLFGTNVSAIIATGTVVFLSYRVRQAAIDAGLPIGRLHRGALVTAFASVVILAIPLSLGSSVVLQQEVLVSKATPVARAWAKAHGGQISDVTYRDNSLRILAIGLLTLDQVTGLRPDLDAAGLGDVDVLVTLVAGGTKELPGKP